MLTPRKDSQRFGFALIIALALMAFVVLLLLSLSTLTSVEIYSSTVERSRAEARQNALLGLETALGQLQAYAGADQRVTVPATSVFPAKDPYSGSGELLDIWRANASRAASDTYLTPSERDNWNAAINDWWNSNGYNPHYLAVFDSSQRVDLAGNPSQTPSDLNAQVYENNPDTTYGEFKRQQKPVWLVSGNERFGYVLGDDASYPGDSDYITPLDVMGNADDPNSNVVWVVGEGSATTADQSTDGLDGRVKVPKVEIASSQGVTVGHYAYWVGDESLKANFNVQSEDPSQYSPGTEDYRNFLQVPQRVGWDNMTGFELNQTSITSPFDPIFGNLLSVDQIELVDPYFEDDRVNNNRGPVARNFHSLTSYSKSLLTDTALGGLKKDLTAYFESGTGLLDNDPIADPALYSSSDPRFGSGSGFPSSTQNIGTWGDLKDWYESDAVDENSSLPVEQGRAPILANYQMFVAFTHKDGSIQHHFMPCVVLWNPFDAGLQSTTYRLRWRHNYGLWRFAVATQNMADPTDSDKSDGEVFNGWYIHQLSPLSWYSRSAPSAKNFGTQFDNSDGSLRDPWNASNNNPAQYRFSPLDTGSGIHADPPGPDEPNSTWVTYELTASFKPGQALVFTIDPNGNPIYISDPASLHDGTTIIPLTNDFDSNFPVSYYFDIASFVDTSVSGVDATPTSASNTRFHAAYLNQSNPGFMSMELSTVSGELLWRTEYMGSPGNWGPHWTLNYTGDSTEIKPTVPSSWRKLYQLDDWEGVNKSGTTGVISSPLVAMPRGRLSPFDLQHTGIYDNADRLNANQIKNHYRAFANFNLSAPNMDMMQQLESSRNAYNTTDGFGMLNILNAEYYGGTNNLNHYAWYNDQYQFNGNETEGFTLMEWRSQDTGYLNIKGLSTIPLRHVKRAAANLLSMGQFQQANTSRYAWQPGFAIGNSEASPYADRARVAGLESYTVGSATDQGQAQLESWYRAPGPIPNNSQNELLDVSYLLNESLWDRYFLSSIPQSGSIDFPLANQRYRQEQTNAATDTDLRDFDTAAAHLYNYGSLNVNSTSKEAWKALLTAFRDLQLENDDRSSQLISESVPISRNLDPSGNAIDYTFDSFDTSDVGATSNHDYSPLFEGFRYLTDPMIDELAKRIVDEVRLRAPFFSVADFVNRRLIAPDGAYTFGSTWQTARTNNQTTDSVRSRAGHPYGVPSSAFSGAMSDPIDSNYDPLVGMSGINGALQRAINVSGINGGVNTQVGFDGGERVFRLINDDLEDGGRFDPTNMGGNDTPLLTTAGMGFYLDTEHLAGAPTGEAGQLLGHAPAFVTQADLLTMLGPALTARGDTFVIRTYGDSVNPLTSEVQSRAWLEAVVQRVAEPVDPADPNASNSDESRWQPTSKFGRKFKVLSVRWLTEEEV